MNPEFDDDPLPLFSHYYPDHEKADLFHHFPQQGRPVYEMKVAAEPAKPKPRRRRRKNKEEEEEAEGMMRKRKLREEQVKMLEMSFGTEQKLESERKDRLAAEIGLDPRQVAVWFQNRRARWKSKKLEEEYSKLKSEHDSAVLEKCRLQSQLVKLKDQLEEAEREIQRLSERSDGFSSNSPSSSFSIDPPNFLGEFGMESLCMPEINNGYAAHGMEWGNLYFM